MVKKIPNFEAFLIAYYRVKRRW